MKKVTVFVFALLLGASLSFAQNTGGDKGKKGAATTASDKDKDQDKDKDKEHKGGKKGHKGGKKSKKGSSPTTPPPK